MDIVTRWVSVWVFNLELNLNPVNMVRHTGPELRQQLNCQVYFQRLELSCCSYIIVFLLLTVMLDYKRKMDQIFPRKCTQRTDNDIKF